MKDKNKENDFLDNNHECAQEHLSGEYQITPICEKTEDNHEQDCVPEEQQAYLGSSHSSKSVMAMTILVLFFVGLVVLLFSGLALFAERFMPGILSSKTAEISATIDRAPSTDHVDDRHFSIEDATRLPSQENKEPLSTVEIAALVGPATVSIEADIPYGLTLEEQFLSSAGSGFIISEDGYIVTNRHVIVGSSLVRVVVPGYEEPFLAEIIGFDDRTDIAVLKVQTEEFLPYAILGDSDELMPGELAVAIGNPFGELAGTVTVGVISALNRDIAFEGAAFSLIQTDASINTGNSGGPLLNSFGEVVGVTNAKIATGEGLGFAIPINTVRDIIDEIIDQGYVSGRPIMGVTVVTIDYREAEMFGWPVGVYIRNVTENGPADKAGLLPGDIITKMNDEVILDTSDVLRVRNELEVGDEIIVETYRNNERMMMTIVLEEGSIS